MEQKAHHHAHLRLARALLLRLAHLRTRGARRRGRSSARRDQRNRRALPAYRTGRIRTRCPPLLETIRPIPEDGEAREKRISLLTEPLHSGALPDAAFVRRVLYLAGRWYHRPDQMDAEGALMLRKYLLRVWPEYAGEPVTTKLIRLWRTSEYVIGTVTVNSTLN